MGSPQRRSFGRVRLPRNPLYGDHGIYPDAPPNARARHPLQLVGQRKDRTGSGPRHVVRRQAGPGLHEARGHERLRRRFRQFSHDGCQRRPGGRSGGRSLDALLAERTGLPLLRQIRHDSLLRTRIATGSLRDDRRGVRLLGEIPDSGADARDDSRAVVEIGEPRQQNTLHYPERPRQWILMPGNSRVRYKTLIEENKLFEQEAEHSRHNRYIDGPDKSMGIIACGLAYNYIMENFPEGCPFPVLKISQYPLPTALVQRMASECRSLLIVEEGQPLVEEMIRGLLGTPIPVKGRLSGELPRTGELTPDNVRGALGLPRRESEAASQLTMPRPPALCQGCGHRDVYTALNDVLREHYPDHKVFSDIGCYTLGSLPPFRAIDTCVEMGASVTMAKGAADGGQFPSVAVIGDSTFTHSGMTALLDAVNEKSNITVVISDNLTTGMTGGQDSAGTGRLEQICAGLGVEPEHIRVVVPLPKNMEEIRRTIREEIEYKGVSVIIPRRECIQTAKRHNAKKQ